MLLICKPIKGLCGEIYIPVKRLIYLVVMRKTVNFRAKRARLIRQSAKIRQKAKEGALKRSAEAKVAKTKKIAIKTLKQRFLNTRSTIKLLEAELRRFSRLSGISKVSEKHFIKPTKPRRQGEITIEARINSISNRKKRHEMAKEKWKKLIREIDVLSQKERRIRVDLESLCGEHNLTEFIKRHVEPEVWVEPKEPAPYMWKPEKYSTSKTNVLKKK